VIDVQCIDSACRITRDLCSAAARLIKTISTGDVGVVGVTSVDDAVFVLLNGNSDQVAVYSVNDYRLLRHLSLPALKPCYPVQLYDVDGLTSCVRHRCLYASYYGNTCVHRYDLASSAMSKWSVPGQPCGLSVTPSCNLLVTCWWPNKLLELSADSGQCVRAITLQSGIQDPWHAVQLTTGQYVVCLRQDDRVCIVDDGGGVTRSYGGQRGSGVGQLDRPRHLAVDEDSQFVFVADTCNDRVVVLSPTLEFLRYISEGLSGPQRLYLHQATRRLYVGQRNRDVAVIQL